MHSKILSQMKKEKQKTKKTDITKEPATLIVQFKYTNMLIKKKGNHSHITVVRYIAVIAVFLQ